MPVRRAGPWTLLVCLASCGRDEPAAPLPAPDIATSAPAVGAGAAASGVLFQLEPLETLSKLPLVALSQWTQGRFADIPDIPLVTVFDDGSVVAWRERDGRKQFVEATLTRAELDRSMAAVRDSGLLETAPDHRGELATHTPSTTILLRHDGRWKRVTVEGFLDGKMLAGQTHQPPPAFVTAQRTLAELPLPGAKPWKHRHVLVHARALSTTATSQPWPAELPTPGPSTFPPGDDQDKRYVVAVAHELAARSALARTKELPFSHEGKSWQVLAVEPTLEAWTYLERVRYCSANPRACR